MTKVKGIWMKAALVLLPLGLLGLGWTLTRGKSHSGHAKEAAGAAAKYQCPMHPQIVRDEPGDCPICHMKLDKVEMDASHGHAHDPSSLDAHGEPAAGEKPEILRYRHPMNPKVFSDKPMKDEMGMDFVPVYAGDGADEAGEGGGADRAAFTLSPYRRQLIGVRSEAAGEHEVLKTLRLPGRVGEDPSVILAQALEMDGGLLRSGLKAEVRLAEGEAREAVVEGVDSRLDSYSRSFAVFLRLTQAPGRSMRPGVYCDVRVQLRLARGLAVPREAVLDTGDRQVVFVEKEAGRFEPREVVLGKEGDSLVELRKGLKAGEKVVVSANFLIDSESRFKAAAAQY